GPGLGGRVVDPPARPVAVDVAAELDAERDGRGVARVDDGRDGGRRPDRARTPGGRRPGGGGEGPRRRRHRVAGEVPRAARGGRVRRGGGERGGWLEGRGP